MRKDISVSILQECMDYVNGLDRTGIEKMKAIYEEEKRLSNDLDDSIQIVLPGKEEYSLDSQIEFDNYELTPDEYGIKYTNQQFSEAKTSKNEYIAA